MKIHLISSSLREESASRSLASLISSEVAALGADVAFTDIRDLPPVLCDGRPSEQYPAAYRELRSQVLAAQAVVLAIPIHQYAPSGASKNLLEIIGSAMEGKLVGLVSAAGSARSMLATGGLLMSLMFDLRCLVLPRMVQSVGGAEDVHERVAAFSSELLRLARAISEESLSADPQEMVAPVTR